MTKPTREQAKDLVTITCAPGILLALLAQTFSGMAKPSSAASDGPEQRDYKLLGHMVVDHDVRIKTMEVTLATQSSDIKSMVNQLTDIKAMVARIDERTSIKK